MTEKRSTGLMIAAIVALIFGALTILSGGRALFGGVDAQAAVGNAVPFVLWFNFVAGFAYVAAGAGLFLMRPWALWLSIAILGATALVLLAFGVYVFQGGAYEMRTVGAMILRTGVWLAIVISAVRSGLWGRARIGQH